MKRSIKAKLSSTIFIIVLVTIAMISFLMNYFINRQFTDYIKRQQALKTQVIISTISQQYNPVTEKWDLDYIHSIGMFSLYDGYIIKVYDKDQRNLWDAQAHDMTLCARIIHDISERMRVRYPQLQGEFSFADYPLEQEGQKVGTVSIGNFGPFFLNDNDFRFLRFVNRILIGVGAISLLVSLIVGHFLAKRLSNPILKTVDATKKIADGNYEIRINEESDTRELDMLVGSINHLAGSLQTLERLRKQLTGDVAHELRTPITILQSHIEAMTEGLWEPTKERLGSCYDEVSRIGILVSDLEKLAKIEDNNLKLNKITLDLNELMEKLCVNFEAEFAGKDLQYRISGPGVVILADQERISQVVVNLLSNAIKYSNRGGNIDIILFETGEEAGFHMKDNGIGIPEEEQPFIFERFYRADKSRNRLTGGSGIGLTIVKSIVEAHGGTIQVESKLHQGSSFTVTLPKN